MPEDPRDHAVRKFDTDPNPPLWSALAVIVRYATDQKLGLDFTSAPHRPDILRTSARR